MSLIKLGKETLIYGVGQVVTKLVGVLTIPLLTRLLSVGQMGQLDLITTIQGLLTTVLLLGTDTAITFHYWDHKGDVEAQKSYIASGFLFVLSTGMAGALLLWLVTRAIGTPEGLTNTIVLVATLQIPNQILYQMFTKLFRIFRRPAMFIAVTIFVSGLNIAFLAVMLHVLHWGFLSAVLSQFVVFGLANVFCLVYFREYLFARPARKRLAALVDYGWPLVLFSVSDQLVAAVQRPILLTHLSLEALGLFSVSTKIAAGVGVATKAFTLAWGPFSMSIKDDANAAAVYGRIARLYLWGGLLVVLTIQCVSPIMVKLLSGPAYSGAVHIVPVISLALILQSMYGIHAVGLNVVKKTGFISMGSIFGLVLALVFTMLLTPLSGIFGAATAMVAAYLTTNAVISFIGNRYYPIKYEKGPVVIMVIGFAALMAFGMVTQPRSLTFTPSLVLGPLLFLALFLIIERKEINVYLRRFRHG